jgi:hypothetical protein
LKDNNGHLELVGDFWTRARKEGGVNNVVTVTWDFKTASCDYSLFLLNRRIHFVFRTYLEAQFRNNLKISNYTVWGRLHEYPSNNKLSKIVKLLITRLFWGCASPKTKITVHFILNIAIFESILFQGYLCKCFKLCVLTNFEVVFLVICFIS